MHKFERYLRHGSSSVATVYGPVVFGNQPCILLRETADEQAPELVGMGSYKDADTTRIIAKRIILSGHPFKVHRKTATVRYMFFNSGMCLKYAGFLLIIYVSSPQTTSTTSNPSNSTQNWAVQVIYVNHLERTDTSRHILTVKYHRWIPYVCPCTKGFILNGVNHCGRVPSNLMHRLKQTKWKSNGSIFRDQPCVQALHHL